MNTGHIFNQQAARAGEGVNGNGCVVVLGTLAKGQATCNFVARTFRFGAYKMLVPGLRSKFGHMEKIGPRWVAIVARMDATTPQPWASLFCRAPTSASLSSRRMSTGGLPGMLQE